MDSLVSLLESLFPFLAGLSVVEANAIWGILALALLLCGYALLLRRQLARHEQGAESLQQAGQALQQGTRAYMAEQWRTVGIVVVLFAAAVAAAGFFEPLTFATAIYFGEEASVAGNIPDAVLWVAVGRTVAFLVGAFCAYLVSSTAASSAAAGTVRAAAAARKGYPLALRVAYSPAVLSGLLAVALSLVGFTLAIMVFGVVAPELLTGFALGFALVALLLRLSGSIHNEAAAAAARQVSQDAGDTTQQQRTNTAVLAELVGDSAGNSAGIASAILGSLAVVFVASLILGLQLGDHLDGEPGDNLYDLRFFIYPLFTYGTALVAGLIGNAVVRTDEKRRNAMAALKRGFNISAFVVALVGLIITILYMEEAAAPGFSVEWRPYCNVFGGIVLALLLHKSTEYFTSTRHRLVKGVSRAAQSGSVPSVTAGLALSFESVVWAVIVIAGATLSSASIYRSESGETFLLFVLYGVALTGLGMLTLASSTIAIESFGAVTSSARRLGQLAALDKNARNALEDLDVVGTTGQMMARGLANGAAALAAISVFGAFAASSMLASEPFISINIARPLIFVALLLGAAFPLLFSALALRPVARAAARMARVAAQNTAPAEAAQETAPAADTRPISSLSSATRGAVIGLGLAALVVPALIVVLLEPEGLSAFLVGAVLSALLLTISHANAGGAWGNARRYIEDGFYGGKNSPTAAAAHVSDTVGGALRATTGVILAPLLTLVGVVVLIFGPVQLRLEPLSPVNMGVMALSLALLALVFWWSRHEPDGEARTSAKPQPTRTTSSKKRSREMAREQREREREKEDTV